MKPLQKVMRWAKRDIDAWPQEHLRMRAEFALAGLIALGAGVVAVSILGVPAGMPSAPFRPMQFVLGIAMGILVLGFFCLAPFVLFMRYVRSFWGSFVAGAGLVGSLVYAFAFMVTSTSSTAGLAILLPAFLSYGWIPIGIVVSWIEDWTRRAIRASFSRPTR